MLVYLKNTAFVLLLYLTNWPIGIKAMDSSLREKDSLIPKSHSSIREKEVNNNNPPKQGKPIENPATIKFREKIDTLAEEFEGFESLSYQQQQNLLKKWKRESLKDWLIQANFARLSMMEDGLVVSNETLKKVYKLYPPEEKSHCVLF